MIGEHLYGAVVIDLFSGTGNLGLESLSRGAEYCYFCDISAESNKLIKKNMLHCGVSAGEILRGGYAEALKRVRRKADIIFLDPPYRSKCYEDCFSMISDCEILNEDGLIVAEYSRANPMPGQIREFQRIKEKRYGGTGVSVYSRGCPPGGGGGI
jgi:16S rRNA (guanine(966)-N(2))-methyltransferase RsmD